MYLFWSFRRLQDGFKSFIKSFFYFWVFLRFSKILTYFIGSLQEVLDLFLKINDFFGLFRFFSAHWRFVLILWEFSVNIKDFSQFFYVSWIFLDFMGYSWLVLEFLCIFLVFSMLSRLSLDCLKRFFRLLGFLKFFYDFSSVFWEFIRNWWYISQNYCFSSEFVGSSQFIEDLFWFSESFLWI